MSTTAQPGQRHARATWALAALFLTNLVLGTFEFLVVGILIQISEGLEVSISTAGTLVTAYALGISIGGPLLTAATIRFSRRGVLWTTFTVYLVLNALVLVIPNFGMFLVIRVLTGSMQGLFIGVSFAVAASIVERERVGQAISIVVAGVAVATAVGVPAGTLLGQATSWQVAFLVVILFGVVALAALVVFLPSVPHSGAAVGIRGQARQALAPRVLAVLAFGLVLMGGQYAAYTYITPFLEEVTGVSGNLISLFLLAYGVTAAIGVFVGGWFADRSAVRTLIGANALLIAIFGILYLVGAVPVLVAVLVLLWGLVGFGLVPSLQYRVIHLAGEGRDLAASFPVSAVNAGIASGALVGGWAVANHGFSAPMIAAMLICLATLPVSWATSLLRAPSGGDEAGTASPAGDGEEPAAVST